MKVSHKNLPNITDAGSLAGKRVLVRASLNVPIEDGGVRNYFRIMRAVPTLMYLINEGAKVIVIGHIGRDPKLSLKPVYEVLREHMSIGWCDEAVGTKANDAISALKNGEVILLENLRSHEGEKANDPEFAKTLASYADIYVNDAFPDSHRAHASIVGIPAHIPGYMGKTFAVEYEELEKAMSPKAPSLLILGGAKAETKEPLLKKYIEEYDNVFVGGALANDFFKAKGFEVGTSLLSDEPIETKSLLTHTNLLLPVDVVVKSDHGVRTTIPQEVMNDEMILDAGPKTLALLKTHIDVAKTILWNGPLGDYEHEFGSGTNECARMIAASDAYSIVGGGDTVAAIESLALNDQVSFVSTAGGAMLMFLQDGTLPGIDAILASHE